MASEAGDSMPVVLSGVEREVFGANAMLEQLDLHPDSAKAARIYSGDFLNVTQGGDVRGKDERLSTLLSSEPRYERIVDSDVRIRAVGDAALVTGRSLVRVQSHGETRQGSVRFLRLFVHRGGAWAIVAQQVTGVAAH
jgi:hypothetical protein